MSTHIENNINFVDGAISISDARGNTIVITELPMDEYEKFYKFWHLGMSATVSGEGKNQSFTQAWVFNSTFRDNMEAALKVLGVTQPGNLSVTQLQTLLIKSGDTIGLAFRLHQDSPVKPQAIAQLVEKRSQKKPLSTNQKLAYSIKRGLFALNSWVNRNLPVFGL